MIQTKFSCPNDLQSLGNTVVVEDYSIVLESPRFPARMDSSLHPKVRCQSKTLYQELDSNPNSHRITN